MITLQETLLVCQQVARTIGTLHNLAIYVDEEKARLAWGRAYRGAQRAKCELKKGRATNARGAMEVCLEQTRVLLTLANQSGRHPEACASIELLVEALARALAAERAGQYESAAVP